MDRVLGGHRAVGYRSPGADLSPNSTRLLADNGFTYESSLSAKDFGPHWCRTGDVIRPNLSDQPI
jgi:peptidoglycan-N-acetylglucosamine deacetylase